MGAMSVHVGAGFVGLGDPDLCIAVTPTDRVQVIAGGDEGQCAASSTHRGDLPPGGRAARELEHPVRRTCGCESARDVDVVVDRGCAGMVDRDGKRRPAGPGRSLEHEDVGAAVARRVIAARDPQRSRRSRGGLLDARGSACSLRCTGDDLGADVDVVTSIRGLAPRCSPAALLECRARSRCCTRLRGPRPQRAGAASGSSRHARVTEGVADRAAGHTHRPCGRFGTWMTEIT